MASLVQRLPVCERTTEFLLEGQEETGCQRKRCEPQRRDRVELGITAERHLANLEERIRRAPCDEQSDADRHGALWQRCAAMRGCGGRGDESLRLPAVTADESEGAARTHGCRSGFAGRR